MQLVITRLGESFLLNHGEPPAWLAGLYTVDPDNASEPVRFQRESDLGLLGTSMSQSRSMDRSKPLILQLKL